MSSSLLIVLMAFTSFLVHFGRAFQTANSESIADLLLKDEFQRAEELLDRLPKTAETIAFQGEVEFRKGDFDRAEALYNQALEIDEKTARAYLGLAKLSMSKLKGSESLQAVRRAIALDSNEPLYRLYASEASAINKNYADQLRYLEEYIELNPNHPDRIAEAKAGLEMLKALGIEDLAIVTVPDNPTPIRFRKALNLIFTAVMINGRGPYDFAIDTGATQVVLSEKLAMELGLKPITSTVMHGVGGGGKIDTKLFSVDEVAFGEVKIKNIPIGTFNDPLVTQIADGILGTSVLSDFIITVNYPDSQLELARKPNPTNGDSEILPARYFSNLLLVPLEVNGQFGGNFVVDTGAVTTVLSHSTAAKLGITEETPGAKIDLSIAGVGGFEGVVLRVPNVTLKAADIAQRFTEVVAIDLKEISKMIGTEVAGVVGYDFFADYKVVLDYYGAEVRLMK